MADRFLSRVPRVSELYRLVVKHAAYKWEELCMGLLELDEDGAKLEAIRRDFIQLGVERCCLQVFLDWVRGEGALPVSWCTVITCLQDMEMHKVARDIKEAFKDEEAPNRKKPYMYCTLLLSSLTSYRPHPHV